MVLTDVFAHVHIPVESNIWFACDFREFVCHQLHLGMVWGHSISHETEWHCR